MAHGADEGRATLGRARDSMQLECVQLEVRELRQELQGGLDRLLKALLQPLGELQEALLEARPTPARSEIPDFSAWLAEGAPKRKSERTRAVPKAAPSCDGEGPSRGDGQGRPRRNVVNGQAALDYTYVENNCDSASAVEDASVKSKERSEKSSSMSTLGQHVPRQIHTAQESIKQHLYFSHGLHQVEEFVAEPNGPVRRKVAWLVKTHQTAFEAFIGCIIVANSICIGLEIEISLGRELHGHEQEGQESILAYLEICFLAVYTLELLLRFIADGWDVFRNMWFLFDFSMVAVGGLATVLANHVVSGEGSGAIEVLEQAPLIRNLRLVRLVRAVRMVELFQDLWKLCVGLMKSARTVTSAAVLVTMVAYVFGCAALELIAKSQRLQANPVTKEILDNHFSSLGHVMVTMIQFVNADSIGAIYFPLILENPIVGIFFCMLIGVVSILLMNLVTAAVVESAIKTGKEDLCMQRHRIIKQVEHMIPLVERAFREMDVTQDDKLDRDELERLKEVSASKGIHLPPSLHPLLQGDTLKDLFDYLDQDNDGKVASVEFIEGACKLALSNVPIETMQILSLLRQQRAQLVDVHELVSELRLLRRSRRSSLQDESLQGVHDLVSELQLLDSRLEVTGCQGERRQQRRVSFGDAAEQFGPSGSATQERHLQEAHGAAADEMPCTLVDGEQRRVDDSREDVAEGQEASRATREEDHGLFSTASMTGSNKSMRVIL